MEEQLTNYIGVRLANTIDEPVPLGFSFEVDGVNLLGILKAENTILVVCFTMIITKAFQKLYERNVLLIGLLLFVGGYTVISISTMGLVSIGIFYNLTKFESVQKQQSDLV